MQKTILYLGALTALLISTYLVFRVLVRRDYQRQGRLTLLSSVLELIVWLAYMAFPYLYNPPCWPYVWVCESPMHPFMRFVGYILIIHGAVVGFGSMAWLGLGRSFGRNVSDLHHSGPYKYTRNPQLLGGLLMVLGVAVLWPSWYALGWVGLWGLMSQLMVLSEEEHLKAVYGDEYSQYCTRVPRYFGAVTRE